MPDEAAAEIAPHNIAAQTNSMQQPTATAQRTGRPARFPDLVKYKRLTPGAEVKYVVDKSDGSEAK